MKLISGLPKLLAAAVNFFIKGPLVRKIILVVAVIGLGFAARQFIVSRQAPAVTYQTEKATKGTLITAISGSGTITSGNNTDVTTKVSGVVNKVYVTNGDQVTKGQKIAEVTLDDYAKERQTAAWASYLDATVALKQAIADKSTSDITMWNSRQAVLDAQDALDDMNSDDTNPATHEVYTAGERAIIIKTLDQTRKAFTVAESKYLTADSDITAAQAKVASTLRDYQVNSSTITAPVAGVISNLSLASGMVVSASSTTSSTNGSTIISSQTVGKISDPAGQLVATVNLSEIDITTVKANQKVTLTLDAFSDKTFTGKVLSINTSGSVSSGVTSYPVTIILDPVTAEIYPNMAVTAQIITNIVTDTVMIPTTAITTANGQSTVQVKKDGKISTVTVEIGSVNDSQTEIKSGLSEGDAVVTSIVTASSSTTDDASSPFSGTTTTKSSGSTKSSGGNSMPMGGPPGF